MRRASIKPKGIFINILIEMTDLHTPVMGAQHPALQKRDDQLYQRQQVVGHLGPEQRMLVARGLQAPIAPQPSGFTLLPGSTKS